ncbi:MAG: hypothetical protein AW07_01584 [Candidatus Accumulibacter sp. SK-11]|nr:MAG: hypothetical protein AW07_01584 [Candidatus Accumulibacter sp. SK-11]
MGQMVGQIFAGEDQVARQATVRRHLQSRSLSQGSRCGSRLRHRTDAADARHDDQRVARLLADQHVLEATVECGADLGRNNPASADIEPYFEVALDTIERADRQPPAHASPLRPVRGTIRPAAASHLSPVCGAPAGAPSIRGVQALGNKLAGQTTGGVGRSSQARSPAPLRAQAADC